MLPDVVRTPSLAIPARPLLLPGPPLRSDFDGWHRPRPSVIPWPWLSTWDTLAPSTPPWHSHCAPYRSPSTVTPSAGIAHAPPPLPGPSCRPGTTLYPQRAPSAPPWHSHCAPYRSPSTVTPSAGIARTPPPLPGPSCRLGMTLHPQCAPFAPNCHSQRALPLPDSALAL